MGMRGRKRRSIRENPRFRTHFLTLNPLFILATAMVKCGLKTSHKAFRSHIRPQVGAHRGNQRLLTRIATRTGVKTVTLGHDMHVSRCRSSLIITMMYCSNVYFRLADRAIGRSTGYGDVTGVLCRLVVHRISFP